MGAKDKAPQAPTIGQSISPTPWEAGTVAGQTPSQVSQPCRPREGRRGSLRASLPFTPPGLRGGTHTTHVPCQPTALLPLHGAQEGAPTTTPSCPHCTRSPGGGGREEGAVTFTTPSQTPPPPTPTVANGHPREPGAVPTTWVHSFVGRRGGHGEDGERGTTYEKGASRR